MVVFRWAMGVLVLLMGSLSLLSFGIFIATDIDVWMERTRRFRRWASAAALFWFNVEVWGSVVLTIITW